MLPATSVTIAVGTPKIVVVIVVKIVVVVLGLAVGPGWKIGVDVAVDEELAVVCEVSGVVEDDVDDVDIEDGVAEDGCALAFEATYAWYLSATYCEAVLSYRSG